MKIIVNSGVGLWCLVLPESSLFMCTISDFKTLLKKLNATKIKEHEK